MQRKELFLVGGVVCILGIAGYFALRKTHTAPVVVTEKVSEGTLGTAESPASGTFSELARSRDGRLLAVVTNNKAVGVLNPTQETSVREFESSDKEWIYGPTFSPDGALLATVSSTPNAQSAGHLLLWDAGTGQRLASVDDLSWPVCCASFSPDGTAIAVAGNTKLYLIDAATRQVVQQAEMEHVLNGVVLALAFSPDGDLLATAKRNGKVELWQLPNLNLLRTFSVGPSLRSSPGSADGPSPNPPAMSVAIAHNLSRIAANNSEGSIFVWDLNTGREVIRYVNSASSAQGNSSAYAPLENSLYFTLDDRWLLTLDQKTNGIRLLSTEHHQETDNVLSVPAGGVMETMNASASDGSVGFTYRIFHPGESGPPTAKVDIWALRLR